MENHPPFHEQLRYERERRGWSQADIAEKVGCETKTVGRWERGECLPRPHHRLALSELFGKSVEELGLVKKRPRKTKLPATSALADLVEESLPQVSVTQEHPSTVTTADASALSSPKLLREDWDETPQVVGMYGRDRECAELAQWLADRHCRVVTVLGMGGVGKTSLATTVAIQVKESFEYIFWRSLQNAPPLELILKQCLRFLSHYPSADLSENVNDELSLLIQYLRNHRCLLVLDNVESILQPGQGAGRYRQGYELYGKLIKTIGEAQHQSCLLLTSREKLKAVVHLEGKTSPVRSLQLSGIELTAGRELLKEKELFGSDRAWAAFVDRYSGNPLALQLVAEPIREMFGGDIAQFLQANVFAFGDVNDLLEQHFQRLSAEEQVVMYWLAIERETVSLDNLHEDLVYPMPRGTLLATLGSLRRRSMIETRGPGHFTLQPVIMEYVTTGLVERAVREFTTEVGGLWMDYALIKAKSRDYVRESQRRLLLAPVAEQLLATLGRKGMEQMGKSLLSVQRQLPDQHPGYLAGNMLNLLNYLQSGLRGFDFSDVTVRQAYLQHVSLPSVNFTRTHFVATVFTNTFGNVLAVACSPRGDLLAVGTTTGEVLIYQMLSGILLLTCHGHTDGIWSVAFCPDGRVLASSGDDHTIRLWDSVTGRCLRMLQDHTNRVRAVAFSPDGKLLASGSDDEMIRLWEVSTGQCLNVLRGHTSRVWSVMFSPDGKLLASGSTDQTIGLWDSATGGCLKTLQEHSGWIRSVAFNADGSLLASGGDDETIRLWEVSTGRCLNTLRGHSTRVWSVAFSPDGRTIASGSEDQTIRLWNVDTGECLKMLQGHTYGVRCVTFNVDGHILVSGGDDQTCRLWDMSTGYCLTTLQGYTNRVWSIAFRASGGMLASLSECEGISLWDVNSGKCLKTFSTGTHGGLAVAFSPDGRTLASGGQDETVCLWDVSNGRCLGTLRGHTNWVRTVAFHPAGNLLASGGEDQTICLWDVSTAQNLRTLEGHTNWIRTVAFSPEGSLLASGGDDQTIRLWDVNTGRCLDTWKGHTNRVRSIAFSPDGAMLASGSEDQTIRLWEVSTGRCLTIWQGHSSWVRSVAFSPDGSLVASGSEDQTVRLWEVSADLHLHTLRGHTSRIRSVAFSPDGNLLASSTDDSMVKLWDIATVTCLKTLISERPYEGMNITDIQGLTEAQKASLRTLGAIEDM